MYVKTNIKDLDISLRPRERLKKVGVQSLSNVELLAIILRTGNKELNAKDLALEIVKSLGSINNLQNVTLEELESIKGIKDAKAITILAAIELGKRVLKKDNNNILINNNKIIYDLFKYDFVNTYQEKFIALFLDTKNNLIASELIYIGTLSSANVHPREIFKLAVKHSAQSIIVVHNHPSGNSMPSKADIELTKSLMNAGDLMKIPILDHIIIGNKNYYSFYDKKVIKVEDEED